MSNYKKYWRLDFLSGFSVALVALPLSIGIAIAMGLPVSALMAGLVASMVGGVFCTFLRSGHVSINGPSAALIGIVIGGMSTLGQWEYMLAAFVCAGALQIVFGLFKMGRLADFIPSSVVQGMMAAIGVIILAGQFHTGLGVKFSGATDLDNLLAIPNSLLNMNPLVAIIFFNSLVILAFHPYSKSKFIKFVPAPIWLLLFAVPLYMLFNYLTGGEIKMFGAIHKLIDDEHLVQLPENILAGFTVFPNFAKLGRPEFWVVVLSVFLISTIETLGSAKAIDKIDPLNRKTDLNRDVAAMGISTILSGIIGGLPVIAVIARSSVNVNHGAKTKLSNLIHGLIIVLMVFLLAPFIQMVPKAALMAILVYSGFKLASPKVFKDANLKGYEQLLILVVTLFATLITNLNQGILSGILFTIVMHLVRSHLPARSFFGLLRKPKFILTKVDDHYHLKISGIANFTSLLKLKNLLKDIPSGQKVVFDYTYSRLVDYSFLEFADEWGEEYQDNKGGKVEAVGLDEHITTGEHPFTIHSLPQRIAKPLSNRQRRLKEFCAGLKWSFEPSMKWNSSEFKKHTFFKTRTVEYTKNKITGEFSNNTPWKVYDFTFDEGASMASEEHHATMLRIFIPKAVPDFELDPEQFFNRLLDYAVKEEVSFKDDKKFNSSFSVKGDDRVAVKRLFKDDLRKFIEDNTGYHIECSNNIILVFRYYRISSIDEIQSLVKFGEKLSEIIQNSLENPKLKPA